MGGDDSSKLFGGQRIHEGGRGSAPPPFWGPRYRLFNIGPKVGPPPGPPFLLVDLRWTPLFKSPGSAPRIQNPAAQKDRYSLPIQINLKQKMFSSFLLLYRMAASANILYELSLTVPVHCKIEENPILVWHNPCDTLL